MALTFQMLINNKLFDKLTDCLGVGAPARIVLTCAGFPIGRIPQGAQSSYAFWEDVCRQIESGALPGGFEKLLACTQSQLPANPDFRPFAALKVPSAPVAGGPATVYPTGFASRFDAFVSYSSTDRPQVQRVYDELKRRGIKVWMDEWNLPLGQPFRQQLDAALSEAKAILVCAGPNGFGPWQSAEIDVAIDRQANGLAITIPIFLEGTSPSSLPPLLKRLNGRKLDGGSGDISVLDRIAAEITNANRI